MQVRDAYEYCRNITQRASKTFYWGSVFLPQPKRSAIWAIYAFCRIVDDIVDEAVSKEGGRVGHLSGVASPKKELDYWRRELERVYQHGGADGGPVQLAWSDMLTRYSVPLKPLLELVDGVEMDLTIRRYRTFEELYVYCYRVAGTVGLMSSAVFGYQDEAALQRAVELGIALQLTNILRDIGEDAQHNRIYLPQEEIEQFGYSEEKLLQGVINNAFCDLVRFQIKRAHDYYQQAQPGIALLSADCRLAVRLSEELYRSILERISLNGFNVFTKRASVPLQAKLVVASHFWWSYHFNARTQEVEAIHIN